jgi:predicted MFS family arabinose efflux permease
LLALATFAIGTDAFIIAGILPQISHDLTVTISSAGLVVSVFSISYAVGAPIVSALFSRIPRKAILVGGLAVFMVANILSAISPTLPVLLLTRIIAALAAGLVAPACYAAAAAGLGSEKDRGKNLAIIAAGFTSSTVLGVPLGVFISHFFTWRGSMGFVALLAFIAAVALLTAGSPASKGTEAPASLRQQAQAIGRWQTLFVLTPFLVWSAANFGLYTYIAALLGQRLPANLIPFLLLAFGIGGVIGNMLGGILSDHVGVRRPTFCLLAVLIVTLASVGFAVGTALLAGLVMVVWAASMSALFTLQQQRAIAVSPKQSNLMLALNNSALYFGASIGSAIEGTIISQASLNLAPPASAVMAALSLVLLFLLPQPTTARDRSSASNGKSDTAACN